MSPWGKRIVCGAALAAWLAAPAFAQDGGPLVRGGAALPQFRLSFPSLADQAGSSENLEVSLTQPDKSVFSFLFSPRMQSGETFDFTSGTEYNSAGIGWNVFAAKGFYGGFGLTGSVISPDTDDPLHRALSGASATLHGTLHFGYHIGDRQNLLLSFDHAQTPQFGTDHGELGENLRLGYGVKF
jgi:hypothetical protein